MEALESSQSVDGNPNANRLLVMMLHPWVPELLSGPRSAPSDPGPSLPGLRNLSGQFLNLSPACEVEDGGFVFDVGSRR